MQRRLISSAHKTFCACSQSLHTPVRRQNLFTACSWSPPVCVLNLMSPKTTVLHNKDLQLSQHLCFSSEPDVADQRFIVEYAKRGMAGCKKCKDKIQKGIVCTGKIVPNPFSEPAGEVKEWYHAMCVFEKLERPRATTKKMEDITDVEGWEELQDEDKELIDKHVSVNASPKKKVQTEHQCSADGAPC